MSDSAPGVPMKSLNSDSLPATELNSGSPKPILNSHNTQAISTRANATNDIIMLLTDQRFCMMPP